MAIARRPYLPWLYLPWLYLLHARRRSPSIVTMALFILALLTTCKAVLTAYAAALAQEGGGTDETDEAAAQAAALSLSPTP